MAANTRGIDGGVGEDRGPTPERLMPAALFGPEFNQAKLEIRRRVPGTGWEILTGCSKPGRRFAVAWARGIPLPRRSWRPRVGRLSDTRRTQAITGIPPLPSLLLSVSIDMSPIWQMGLTASWRGSAAPALTNLLLLFMLAGANDRLSVFKSLHLRFP